MDSGQWTKDSGPRTVDPGQWTQDSGFRTVDQGELRTKTRDSDLRPDYQELALR